MNKTNTHTKGEEKMKDFKEPRLQKIAPDLEGPKLQKIAPDLEGPKLQKIAPDLEEVKKILLNEELEKLADTKLPSVAVPGEWFRRIARYEGKITLPIYNLLADAPVTELPKSIVEKDSFTILGHGFFSTGGDLYRESNNGESRAITEGTILVRGADGNVWIEFNGDTDYVIIDPCAMSYQDCLVVEVCKKLLKGLRDVRPSKLYIGKGIPLFKSLDYLTKYDPDSLRSWLDSYGLTLSSISGDTKGWSGFAEREETSIFVVEGCE